MKARYLLHLLLLLSIAACKPRIKPGPSGQPLQNDAGTNVNDPYYKPYPLENPKYPYRPAATRSWDLIHTSLAVDFDWVNERMNGTAELTMKPWFYPQQDVELDAKGFIIQKVAMAEDSSAIPYDYPNLERLILHLDRPYQPGETLKVFIQYTARPSELDSLVSEEAAQDQGLYFINPRGEQGKKPRQIWTQGESHGSPAWFPTFDTPNQRTTSEIAITVADTLVTLSNGILRRSEMLPGGLRTDWWVMTQPHSPYLFTMAIGNFAVVKDQWRGREVSYYVDQEYEPLARMIFGKTPEMIEFFSNRLGVDYPWPKYAQVVVQDFVSGAMENTTATTHYGRLQHDARTHIDRPEEDIIAHELFHQWFGDLVTCESWANLSLNEGFATYGEALWKEYKYGKDAAKEHILSDRGIYFNASQRRRYPIIRYHHKDADEMFDAHSYQKGGQVLHMLRTYVGDDAFFAAIKTYLTRHAFDNVEIHELRMVFEEVTGEDLSWFFDQWYLSPGHPIVIIEQKSAPGAYRIRVIQRQDTTQPVFRLPLPVTLAFGDSIVQKRFWMETRDTTFNIPMNRTPDYVMVDPGLDLLLNRETETVAKDSMWLAQALMADGYAAKSHALQHLGLPKLQLNEVEQLTQLGNHPFWAVREELLLLFDKYSMISHPVCLSLSSRLIKDPSSKVRYAAAGILGKLGSNMPATMRDSIIPVLRAGVNDSSYIVSASCLDALNKVSPDEGLKMALTMVEKTEQHLMRPVFEILQDHERSEAFTFIQYNLTRPDADLGDRISMARVMGKYLVKQPTEVLQRGTDLLMEVASVGESDWLRLAGLHSLIELQRTAEIEAFFEKRRKAEEAPLLKSVIEGYLAKK